MGQRSALARGVRPLPALGAGILAAFRRLGLPHHVAQRRLLVLPARPFIERADNTARILDVKYHLLLPAHEQVGGPLDYFQWAAILRSVSALTAYHWVYRENVKPWLVADLLMLRDEMPRSLASCYENLVQNLDRIAHAYGRQGARSGRPAPSAPDCKTAASRKYFRPDCTSSSTISSRTTTGSEPR